MEYNNLRHLADSWGLLAMAVFFVGAVLVALRPGGGERAKDAANIPFKED
jgi:cytochrome c oxidase cbb3-type subunit IV